MSDITVGRIQSHRNGIIGAPFHVVLFRDNAADMTERPMVAIVFEAPWHVAVLDTAMLAQGNITFGENSWRGDYYEHDLRQAIAEAPPHA